ncbi:MAG: DUF4434 domain-containing protein [Bacteroidetes bacterium]|nr:DUF4434 domain-containing protein [Bacteroidota bacterium]HET6245337.1 glycoside hydrolase family 2 TIM barrel-domain containing protein [Bacteroidia bacterium]
MRAFFIHILIAIVLTIPQVLLSQPIKVEIRKQKENSYILYREGKPYFIKGAGGFKYLDQLKTSGGNSLRLWNTDNAQSYLDSAQALGLTVTLGLFMGTKQTEFDYDNEQQVLEQFLFIKSEVLKYKDHPALLLWGIGNELHLNEKNKKVWNAVNEIAKMIHEIDPNHPTSTMLAGAPPKVLKYISKHCQNLDLIGINVFKELPSVPYILEQAGWNKPYIISEWGASGYWESAVTPWKAFIEESSSQKALTCQSNYENFIKRDKGLCLGTYVFIWGSKNEGTHTLFGLFLNTGEATSMVDMLSYLWTGYWPETKAPVLNTLTLEKKQAYDNITLPPGKVITAQVKSRATNEGELNIKWALFKENESTFNSGEYIEVLFDCEGGNVSFHSPNENGAYRLFVYVFDHNLNKAATGNIPFLIQTPIKIKGNGK